jgi:hypothetical protein
MSEAFGMCRFELFILVFEVAHVVEEMVDRAKAFLHDTV